MTIRPFAERLLENSPLALDMLITTTRRVGNAESISEYSVAGRSGPTKLNFDALPSEDPCPIKKTKRTLPGCSSDFSSAKVRRTSSEVERSAAGPEGFS